MMSVESAEAVILVMMDSVVHRQNCLWDGVRDLPRELLIEALAVLEADGEDVRDARQWFADHGVRLPGSSGDAISVRILDYLGRSDQPRTRVEIEAYVKGKTVHKRSALKSLLATGRVVESGAGSKGNPIRYTMSRLSKATSAAEARRLAG